MFSKGSSVNAFIDAETRFVFLSIFDILTLSFVLLILSQQVFLLFRDLDLKHGESASIPLISKNIPQSVVDLTIASSMISPCFNIFKASFTSAFLLFSSTALLIRKHSHDFYQFWLLLL